MINNIMMNGSLIVSSDKEFVKQLSFSGFKIVIMGERDEDLIQFCNALMGQCLVPSFDAMRCYIDDNMDEFMRIYTQQLMSYEVEELITLIAFAVSEGSNIVLYLSPDEAKLPYMPILLNFITNYYGISVGNSSMPYGFNVNFYGVLLDRFFIHGLIDEYTYLQEYPLELPIQDPRVINKLVNLFNPYVMDRTLEGYTRYFNDYKNNLHQSGTNQFLQDPFSMYK